MVKKEPLGEFAYAGGYWQEDSAGEEEGGPLPGQRKEDD